MSEVWSLPEVSLVVNTGKEWVLNLLHGKTEMDRVRILMLLWRIWHVRNELVHSKPAPSVEASRRFLCSYVESIATIKYYPQEDCIKGKAPADPMQAQSKKKEAHLEHVKRWTLPPEGWVKLNVDGSFDADSRAGGAGMVLRDDGGAIIFSACRYLMTCSSPLEAELAACMEGCALARQWSTLPCIIEMDCLEGVSRIKSETGERSDVTFLLKEIKRLMHDGVGFKVEHIRREQNFVSHALAAIGRSEARTAVWLNSGPQDIPKLCNEDCNPGI
jgi:ribonuclease HI